MSNSRKTYITAASTIGALILMSILGPAQAGPLADPPAVQGPEQVEDWWNAGQAFIDDSKKLRAYDGRAKNVILFVGDGMGVSTITAARILEGQLHGAPGEENRLFFERFPYLALSKTYSWDQQTSDSASTMTAMVTGYKTREGMLSVDHTAARGECDAAIIAAKSLPTILEQAAAAGKATGVISTARITHATPAATYAHTAARDWEVDAKRPSGCGVKDIAQQLIELSPAVKKSLKVALGGGRENFLPREHTDQEYANKKGARLDGRDLTQEWLATRDAIAPSAQYVWNKAGFDAVDPAGTPFLLGLFEPSHLRYEADRAKDAAGEPSLTEMTAKALAMLKQNRKGYFLHVEAGRIDHAHHAGNAKRALLDTIELAKAVKTAYEMTDPKDTLIIVTADHSHVFTIAGYPHRGNSILGLVKSVPEVDGMPTAADKDAQQLPYTTLSYANGPGARKAANNGGKRPDLTEVDTEELDYRQEAIVELEAETHGGEDVAIYASGPKAHLVHGSMEQNWIYHVMREALGFK
ncbi:MAG TPA: alkaline phosphatase [Methylophilaceae bacterium]|nr:alkaline phosphatase [Methylophilaceae bacterium]